eukprot:2950-Chlamydomonas_euryale.AAC.3
MRAFPALRRLGALRSTCSMCCSMKKSRKLWMDGWMCACLLPPLSTLPSPFFFPHCPHPPGPLER